MSTLTPMFDKKTKLITIDDHTKERKTRKDKKIQIKIPVTPEQKLQIARISLNNGHKGEFHSFLDELFCEAVKRDFIQHAKSVPYKDTKNYISTKVNKEVNERFIQLKVSWGLRSKKQAAHRILFNEMGI